MRTNSPENIRSFRWFYLFVCAVGLLFVGIIYAWSIMKVPIAQYFGWTNSQLAFTYTLTMCFFCLGSLFAGWMSKRCRTRILLISGGAFILLGYVATAFFPAKHICVLYITYGVLIGGGIGIAYNVLLTVGNSWFPEKKGTSSGVLMMCFGLSTMILGNIASKLFSIPEIGWQKVFAGLGIAIFAVLVICGFALKKPGPDAVFPNAAAKKRKMEKPERRDYSAREMVRRPTFWIYYVYGILSAAIGSAVFSFARELTMTVGASEALATTIVGVLSVFNGLGRITCGLCFDKLGRKTTMLLSSIITCAAPALMLAALFRNSLQLAIAALCLAGISYGTNPTISSAFVSEFYGTKDFALNYSISNTKLLFSSFAATAATAVLNTTGSYTAPFLLLLGMAIISFTLNFAIRHP